MTFNKTNHMCYLGKCEYGRKNNWNNYLGSGVYLKRAIKKYGIESFDRIILDEADSDSDLRDLEEYYIDFFNAVESTWFYNIKKTSIGGDTFTDNPNKEITREKKSINSQGRNNARFEADISRDTRELVSVKNSKAVIIEGIEYKNIKEFADKKKINESTVYYRLRDKNYTEYNYKNKDSVKYGKNGTKISVDGVIYDSYAKAVDVLGISITTLKNRCKSNNFKEYIILEQAKNNIKKPVSIDGVTYNSLNEASICLNKSKPYIKFRLNSEEFNNYKYI